MPTGQVVAQMHAHVSYHMYAAQWAGATLRISFMSAMCVLYQQRMRSLTLLCKTQGSATVGPDHAQGVLSLAEGCHAYDLGPAYPEDPPSVTAAREQGAKLISQWVEQYNSAKTTMPLSNAADLFELSYSLGGYTDVVNDTLAGSESFTRQDFLEPSANLSTGEFALLG